MIVFCNVFNIVDVTSHNESVDVISLTVVYPSKFSSYLNATGKTDMVELIVFQEKSVKSRIKFVIITNL